MAKIAVTPSIVLAEFILYGKKVSFFKVNEALYILNFLYTPSKDFSITNHGLDDVVNDMYCEIPHRLKKGTKHCL